jgi:hypothetical protein
MLIIAAAASLMRGERFVHAEAQHVPTVAESVVESVVEATAREGDALAVPAVLGEDVAYDEALTARRD